MNILFLKLVALLFMTIDHIGILLLNNNQIFRFFGRIAFPIYAFILVQGFTHVKDNKNKLTKYFFNLFIFAIITEPIYNKVLYGNYFYIESQNILFSLFIYLLCMYIYENNNKTFIDKTISFLIIGLIALLTETFFLNYGSLGLFITFSFYIIEKYCNNKDDKKLLYILLISLYTMLSVLRYNYIELGALLSCIPIVLYNTKKGYNSKLLKYFFYIYYPLHFIILYFLKIYLK